MAALATGVGFTLPPCDPVLGVELVEALLVNEAMERRGASCEVDPLGVGLPHRRRLLLRPRHLGWHVCGGGSMRASATAPVA